MNVDRLGQSEEKASAFEKPALADIWADVQASGFPMNTEKNVHNHEKATELYRKRALRIYARMLSLECMSKVRA